jgi:hypothetical protein
MLESIGWREKTNNNLFWNYPKRATDISQKTAEKREKRTHDDYDNQWRSESRNGGKRIQSP